MDAVWKGDKPDGIALPTLPSRKAETIIYITNTERKRSMFVLQPESTYSIVLNSFK
jgi:hypothetical protein